MTDMNAIVKTITNLPPVKKITLGVSTVGLIALLISRTLYKNISVKEHQAGEGIVVPTTEEAKIATLEPQMQPLARAFVAAARAAGYRITITEARRTIAYQNSLYAKGRTAPGGIVTNAKGGSSPHNYGMAIDFAFTDANGKLYKGSWDNSHPWRAVGKIGEAQGLEWGGDWIKFQDRPHLEMPGWKAMRDAWRAGKLNIA